MTNLLLSARSNRWNELAIRGQGGDTTARDQLLQELLPWLKTIARQILHNEADADDAASASAVKFWHCLPTFDPDRGSSKSLARAMAVNQARDILRRRSRQNAVTMNRMCADRLAGCDQNDPVASALVQEEREFVSQALTMLDPPIQDVLRMRYGENLTYKEVSAALGVAVSTVAARVHRGTQQLQQQLRDRMKNTPRQVV